MTGRLLDELRRCDAELDPVYAGRWWRARRFLDPVLRRVR